MADISYQTPDFKRVDYDLLGNVECCAQCDEPKFPLIRNGNENGGCLNPMCVAFAEQQCSVAFNSPTEIILNLQARLNGLREFLLAQGYEVHHVQR